MGFRRSLVWLVVVAVVLGVLAAGSAWWVLRVVGEALLGLIPQFPGAGF